MKIRYCLLLVATGLASLAEGALVTRVTCTAGSRGFEYGPGLLSYPRVDSTYVSIAEAHGQNYGNIGFRAQVAELNHDNSIETHAYVQISGVMTFSAAASGSVEFVYSSDAQANMGLTSGFLQLSLREAGMDQAFVPPHVLHFDAMPRNC